MLLNAIDFTGDYILYGNFMRLVVEKWPLACEHNLSAKTINRRAWVGHAACCFAIGVPEDITRDAWGKLSNRQRRLANMEADTAIEAWESNRRNNAKDTFRQERFGCGKRENIYHVRPVQQNIFEFLRRKGFNCNATSCGAGSY